MDSARAATKQQFDKKAKFDQFAVGDIVWYYHSRKLTGKHHKLIQPWVGPFRITEIKNLNAILQLVNNHEAKPLFVSLRKLSKAYDTYAELLELRKNLPPNTAEIIAGN